MDQMLSVSASDGSRHRQRNQKGGESAGTCVCEHADSPEGGNCSRVRERGTGGGGNRIDTPTFKHRNKDTSQPPNKRKE